MTVVHPHDFPGSAGVACSGVNWDQTGTPAPDIRPRPVSSARVMIDSLKKAPMKLLLSFCLVIASPAALADTPRQPCETFASTDEVSEPLTIAEIEREDMATLSEKLELRSDYPPVPFGFINAKWVAFTAKFQPGDKIVSYSTDRRSWKHLAGEAGYALIPLWLCG